MADSPTSLAQGRYQLEREVGSGGMATVYLAYDEDLGRRVAVKLLAATFAGDHSLRKRFLREATLAGRLVHPNIVTVFDAGEDAGRPFIVMEYVDGETLGDVLDRSERLPPDAVLALGLQAAAGLGHAHAAGVVHRDVKPQNLLLRADGVLKIADFGIARAAELSRLTEGGMLLGTAAYLAPELASEDEVTAAADVYSLGAVLYELLTGRPPHRFESLADLVGKQAAEPIVPVRALEPEVPDALETAVMHALASRPELRPRDATQLGRELAGKEPEPAPAPARRRRRLWPFSAALLAAIAITVPVALRDGGDAQPAGVAPIAPGATAEEGARNLAAWLRAHAADGRR